MKLVRSLAELYTQKKQFDHALEYYERIKQSEMGNDPRSTSRSPTSNCASSTIRSRELNPFDADHAANRWRSSGGEAGFSDRPNARSASRNFRPTWPSGLRWECCIFKPAKSARPSRNCRRRRATRTSGSPAMSLLAQCFAKRKMYDLAARTLQNAIKEKARL